jgi:hypothetical protein
MTLPPTNPSVPYSKVRSQLGTGDLFFLHGTSQGGVMIEKLEELEGWPPYSHVGMVVEDGGNLYFWDAPGTGVDEFPDPYASDPDNRLKGESPHPGCRVSVLDDVLAYYATRVDVPGFWLRQLQPAVTPDRFGALRLFINRVDGLPFPVAKTFDWGPFKDPEVTGLGENFLAGQLKASTSYGTYFCAQLVADSYMHMGLLEMEVFPPNGYSPATFGMSEPESPPKPKRLRLVPPAQLTPPIFVQWEAKADQAAEGTPAIVGA